MVFRVLSYVRQQGDEPVASIAGNLGRWIYESLRFRSVCRSPGGGPRISRSAIALLGSSVRSLFSFNTNENLPGI